MTKILREAIEAILKDRSDLEGKLDTLEQAYTAERGIVTETSKRVEFLEDLLIQGYTKREASRMLVEADPRVSQRSAETLAYVCFSGQYLTSKRGRRKPGPKTDTSSVSKSTPQVDVPDPSNDAGLL